MKGMICFDMDGTIADLYGVEGWLDYLHEEDPYPYIVADPLCDMDELRKVLMALKAQGWEIRIITWLAKDSTAEYKDKVRKAKAEWLEKYNFPMDACHMVAYGTTKANCVRRYCEEQPMILVDDNDQVRNGWHLGNTIDPRESNWMERLWEMVGW